MIINDIVLSFGAAILELGTPLIIIYLYYKSPDTRKPLLTILGAIFPLIVFYLVVSIGNVFSSSFDFMFSFSAMWLMTLVAYIVLATIGFVLGYLVFRQKSSFVALVSGVAIMPLIMLGVLIFEKLST